MGNPSQSYGASLAIMDNTVLRATRHKWTSPALTPARQAGTRFTYPGGTEGWVDLGSLIAARPGIEPTTAWSQVKSQWSRSGHYCSHCSGTILQNLSQFTNRSSNTMGKCHMSRTYKLERWIFKVAVHLYVTFGLIAQEQKTLCTKFKFVD